MNTEKDQPFIPGEDAILTRDAPALALALEGGWSFPQTCTRLGHADTDFSLLFQCISWKWQEGWDLLTHRWPEIKSDYRILRRVLANAWPEALAQMVPSHFRIQDEVQSSLLVDFMQTVSNPNNEYLSDHDLGRCALHLIANSGNPATTFPGDFEHGDLRLAGHTPWTLAVRSRRWDLASMLAPDVGTARQHPRFEETMETWFVSGFLRESPLRPDPSPLARQALQANGHLLVPWLEVSTVPFLEQAWPLLASLDPSDRSRVWGWVSNSGETGLERLEVLCSGMAERCSNHDPQALELCSTMVAEGGEPLKQAWHRKVGTPPLSAADTWLVSSRACGASEVPDPFE